MFENIFTAIFAAEMARASVSNLELSEMRKEGRTVEPKFKSKTSYLFAQVLKIYFLQLGYFWNATWCDNHVRLLQVFGFSISRRSFKARSIGICWILPKTKTCGMWSTNENMQSAKL